MYQKDTKGRPFALHQDNKGQVFILTNWQWEQENIPVKITKNNPQEAVIWDFSGRQLDTVAVHDPRIPQNAVDRHLYYRYNLILAWK